ncbi:NAD(P)-dependent oxidoreductase [Propionivibrio sp.]|uniref:NAD(P)-dependent oxidoreductase n=1 Tax=Propionivibrio sp. TaxID=2212460 RepID=UPI00272EB566|nr:NAD(P)-dependent oxidoreductase [Propionivibrio sp.]
MKKIGVVGLGIMGFSMADNLLKAGYPLCVHNRNPARAKELVERGAVACATPAEVAACADVVVVMVKADQDVEEVVMGEHGLVKGARPGLVILNSTTILPSTSRRLAAAVAEQGIDMLDCPVTGSAPQARDAKLAFMVGGRKESFELCKPILLAMGKAAYYLGESGTGSYAKLANNTMYAINLLSFVEAVSIASKGGIDPELFIEIVGQGGAKSAVSEAKLPKILDRDFSPAFSLAMMNKDLGLVSTLTGELGVATPVFAAVKAVLGQALEQGWGDEDLSSVVKLYEAWDNHVIRKQE